MAVRNPLSRDLPFASVIVATRGRPAWLAKCLKSLLLQEYPKDRWELIVVEDGSTEGKAVVDGCREQAAIPVAYIQLPHSGPAAARNAGLAEAKGDVVAFLDDDACAAPHWLTAIVRCLQENGVAGVGGRVSTDYPEDSLRAELSEKGDLFWTGSNCEVSQPQEVDFVPGGNMGFWRAALLEIGGFDASFPRAWREETDLCFRLRSRGHRILYDSAVKVFHRAARWSDPMERVKPRVVWHMVRDDAYFRAKNFGGRGVWGAAVNNGRQALRRFGIGIVTLLLAPVHLLAWIPGAIQGLRTRQSRPPRAR